MMAEFKVHALNCGFVLVLCQLAIWNPFSFITVGKVGALKSFPGRHCSKYTTQRHYLCNATNLILNYLVVVR